ncbi:MAG: VOC family protein [Simkaniaceae bacterium]|nr:VOC family protein [Simkaniaceae bacterium]
MNSFMGILRLDHLVLTCKDVQRTAAFYESALGMRRVVFGKGRVALQFGEQKINLHQSGAEVKPNARCAGLGTADLCFISDEPVDRIKAHLESLDVEVFLGPVERTGALAKIVSIYFYDLDGNLIEVSNY